MYIFVSTLESHDSQRNFRNCIIDGVGGIDWSTALSATACASGAVRLEKVWGISARIMLRTMKFDIRRGSSDTKPQSDLSKERLRNDLNTVTNWEKVHFVCSHDLKK